MSDPVPPPEPTPEGTWAAPEPTPSAGWAPPSAAVPARESWPPPPPPAVVPAASAKRRRGLIIGAIVLGSLLILSGIGVAIGLAVQAVVSTFPTSPASQELASGEPGSPVAVEPMTCPEECFSVGSIGGTILPTSVYENIGLTQEVDGWGDYATTSLREEFEYTTQAWATDGASPQQCFFLYYSRPMVTTLATAPDPSDDVLDYTGSHADRSGYSYIGQTVRVFGTSQDAVDHMASLEKAIAGCPQYTIRPAGDALTYDVSAAPALDVPDSIAVQGWVEDSEFGRYYSFDIQRSNLVVRSYLSTDGAVTEEEFRGVVAELIDQVEGLDVSLGEYVPPSACEGDCLTSVDLSALIPTVSDVAGLGAFAADASADLASKEIGPVWDAVRFRYVQSDGAPAACFFGDSDAPLNPNEPEYDARDDLAVPLASFTSADGSVLTETARVYRSELYAGRYLGGLRSAIEQCASYEFDDGTEHRTVTVVPLSFETGAAEVTSSGWLQASGDDQRLIVDLRYRNITVRVALSTTGDPAVAQERMGAYVAQTAARMQALG